MTKFTVTLWREVISTDEVTRTYEAPDATAALEMARADAETFNTHCPDDAREADVIDCKSWQVDHDNVKEL